mmetsp:Transcript_2438/g.7445  ORF Transcript_2438/g.7445 Transcript_2438/m.7445 type:complete len:173 (-) Transcript_2438:247-765(-)
MFVKASTLLGVALVAAALAAPAEAGRKRGKSNDEPAGPVLSYAEWVYEDIMCGTGVSTICSRMCRRSNFTADSGTWYGLEGERRCKWKSGECHSIFDEPNEDPVLSEAYDTYLEEREICGEYKNQREECFEVTRKDGSQMCKWSWKKKSKGSGFCKPMEDAIKAQPPSSRSP